MKICLDKFKNWNFILINMKKWILLFAIITIALVAIFVVIGFQISNTENEQSNQNSKENIELNWYTDIAAAISEAQKNNQQIFAVFTADWCSACKELDSNTLSNFEVQREVSQNYVPLKIDVDINPQLSAQYGIYGIPAILILDSNGREIKRLEGYQTPKEILSIL